MFLCRLGAPKGLSNVLQEIEIARVPIYNISELHNISINSNLKIFYKMPNFLHTIRPFIIFHAFTSEFLQTQG